MLEEAKFTLKISLACECSLNGSLSAECDKFGNCWCKYNFDGTKCEECKDEYYQYPDCFGTAKIICHMIKK